MKLLILPTPTSYIIAITIIRIGIGLFLIADSYKRLSKGVQDLKWVKEQMNNLGITFAPIFFGICIMIAELLSGISLTLGFFTRISASFMVVIMIASIVHHIRCSDKHRYISFAMAMLIIFIALIITGSGPLSVDRYFFS